MIAHILRSPNQEDIDRAADLGMPVPQKQPCGTMVFRRDAVTAIGRNGNVMTVVLTGGVVFECLYDAMTWLILETYLNQ